MAPTSACAASAEEAVAGEMTMRYAHLSPNVRRDAVQVLDAPAPACGQANSGQIPEFERTGYGKQT